ncbi:MAG: mannosyl-oligosaccharide alpha-1,2-mannosidase [Bathelium mastoideum]|nr:MAG: mannosyl-oligosaccharide alpha-1,2-mannosidase [Bathelium mastoideum]
MNLTAELSHARDWISSTLSFDIDSDQVGTFEATTQLLGGLLSAHYLSTAFPNMAPIPVVEGSSGEDLYREKAAQLADRILGAFESGSGIPYSRINLKTMKGAAAQTNGGATSSASAGGIQLELKYVAKLTGEKSYWETAEKAIQKLDDIGAKDGLLPSFVNPDLATFQSTEVRLGSGGEYYYQDLIKQYLQTSKQEEVYNDMWQEAFAGIRKNLVAYSKTANFTFIGERPDGLEGALNPKMVHSSCSVPGTIGLALTGGKPISELKKASQWHQEQEEQLELAKQLLQTCHGMYKATPIGLAPEATRFQILDTPHMLSDGPLHSVGDLTSTSDMSWLHDFIIKRDSRDSANYQSPSTISSLFYLYRLTNDTTYREWGWDIFESLLQHTDAGAGNGFTSLDDVTLTPPPQRDSMAPAWMAQTLKWFYLLFGPEDVLPLNEVVFSGAAHPFPRFELGSMWETGWKRRERNERGEVIGVGSKTEEVAPATTETIKVESMDRTEHEGKQ